MSVFRVWAIRLGWISVLGTALVSLSIVYIKGQPSEEELSNKPRKGIATELLAALKDPNSDVRSKAAEALGNSRDPGAVPSLIAVLKDPTDAVRSRAAEALGKIGDSTALNPLLAALENPLNILSGFKGADDNVLPAVAKALGKMGTAAVGPLITVLKNRDHRVRFSAGDALGYIGLPAIDPLVAVLRDPDELLSSGAAYALARIGAPAVEYLIAASKDQNDRVRSNAIAALAMVDDGRTVALLNAAAKDPDSTVRINAIWALAKTQGVGARDQLIVALQDRDDNVRYFAAKGLKEMRGAPGLVEALVAALSGSNTSWRYGPAYVLNEIGAPAINPLIAALNDPSRSSAAAETLSMIKDPSVIDSLIVALTSGMAGTKTVYPLLIRRGDDPRASDALVRALNSYGDAAMAQDFYNSGQPSLRSAASVWALEHNYVLRSGCTAAYIVELRVELNSEISQNEDGIMIELRQGIVGSSRVFDKIRLGGRLGTVTFQGICPGPYFIAIGNGPTVAIGPMHRFEANQRVHSQVNVSFTQGNVSSMSRSML
jgi:HEAT repeat protein